LNYKEFKEYLNNNYLSIKELDEHLGYSEKSILNNWKAKDKVPEKAVISIHMYTELKKLRLEINNLLNLNPDNQIQLSNSALKIAEEKCKEKDISINEYLTSLVIANI
jgi:hypothetical protein